MTLDKPNFVIIGAQKAGTTSLYHYLSQHPDVYMSAVKEPRFFSHLAQLEAGLATPNPVAVTDLDAYKALFAEATARVVGEASVSYLDVPGTAVWMKRYLPHARLIALLRNPIERAYSQYLMNLRNGKETRPLAEAIADNQYLRGGFYFKNLASFYRHYPAENIKVYLYDDLRHDPSGLVQDVFRFLGLDDTFRPDLTIKHHVGGKPRSMFFNTLLTRTRMNWWIKRTAPARLVRLGITLKQLNYRHEPLPDRVRARLADLYRDDVLYLEKFIDRDLSHWLDLGRTKA